MKKLYKSKSDKVFAGVIGGIGEYLDIDPTILRLAFLVISIMTGVLPSIVVYIVATLIVPNRPEVLAKNAEYTENTTAESKA
jgi:phage shock protein C